MQTETENNTENINNNTENNTEMANDIASRDIFSAIDDAASDFTSVLLEIARSEGVDFDAVPPSLSSWDALKAAMAVNMSVIEAFQAKHQGAR